ncbi:hypothetical protein FKP32DRAFT_1347750 [Trametes sanguinea]|nr:hypothetical protein FKP32DRAFT_1347750 [Trametes sanguinea]
MTIQLTVKETVTLLNYLNRQNLDSEIELVPLRDRLQKEVGLQGEAEESDNVSGSQAETSGPPPSSAQMVFSLNTASSHAVRTINRQSKKAKPVNQTGGGGDEARPPFRGGPKRPCPRGGLSYKRIRAEDGTAIPTSSRSDDSVEDVEEAPHVEPSWIEVDAAIPGLDERAQHALNALMLGPQADPRSEECRQVALYMRELFSTPTTHPLRPSIAADGQNSLKELVARCNAATRARGAVDLLYLINMMHLAIRVDGLKKTNKWTNATVYNTSVVYMKDGTRPAESTFRKWVGLGTRCVMLAAAGSMYLLVVIAMQGLVNSFAALNWKQVQAICLHIRTPDASPLRHQLLSRLLPLLQGLASHIPLDMAFFFPPSLLQHYMVSENLDCRDLLKSDQFLATIHLQHGR